jgi:hypothetical protein
MDGRCSEKSHAFVSCAIWVRNTIGPSGRIAEIDMLVEELPQSEVLGQRRRQHQASVGHKMLVVESHVKTVETVAKYAHRNSAFR